MRAMPAPAVTRFLHDDGPDLALSAQIGRTAIARQRGGPVLRGRAHAGAAAARRTGQRGRGLLTFVDAFRQSLSLWQSGLASQARNATERDGEFSSHRRAAVIPLPNYRIYLYHPPTIRSLALRLPARLRAPPPRSSLYGWVTRGARGWGLACPGRRGHRRCHVGLRPGPAGGGREVSGGASRGRRGGIRGQSGGRSRHARTGTVHSTPTSNRAVSSAAAASLPLSSSPSLRRLLRLLRGEDESTGAKAGEGEGDRSTSPSFVFNLA